MTTFCRFCKTIGNVLAGVDVPHLLHRLVLLNALPELDDVGLEAVVFRVDLDVVKIGEQRLIVCQGHALQLAHPVPAHLGQDPPHQVHRGEHLLHCQGLRCRRRVDYSFYLFGGPVEDSGGLGVLVEQHDDMAAHCKQVP